MKPEHIVALIISRLPGVIPKASWGETSLFYNPGSVRPNGVYFCTIKEHDGDNDTASNINREGVFRLALALSGKTYARLFGGKPKRPGKGDHVSLDCDFTEINKLMPHPVYAWMGWAQILSPSCELFDEIYHLIEEAYQLAVGKFEHKALKSAQKKGT